MKRIILDAITITILVTWDTPLRSPLCRLAELRLDNMAQRDRQPAEA